MKFVDLKPSVAVDVSSFVTYMEPEFLQDDDDGTDLPLPDLAELTPEPQERRPGRNRGGRPLRDLQHEEQQQDTADTGDPEEEAFGEGLTDDEPATVSASDASPPETETQTTGSDKPKRRRRRRRRGRSERSSGGTAETDDSKGEDRTVEDTSPSGGETAAAGSGSSGAPDGKRRRRRRRNRRRKPGSRQTGDTGSTDTSGDSAPTSDPSAS